MKDSPAQTILGLVTSVLTDWLMNLLRAEANRRWQSHTETLEKLRRNKLISL
ncbi:hypothetical protein [Mangrovicoccus ximenensis]|uniref:hypothetical protein n=1 Tax=Mangrovicoccus ximenensis TaxID=1911570 RepID=UPI001374B30D|nr:hypothetical protein [Mangrovicoccus ximenensis]